MQNVLSIIKYIHTEGILKPLKINNKPNIKTSLEFLINLNTDNETENN
jgi:hypothetical protein